MEGFRLNRSLAGLRTGQTRVSPAEEQRVGNKQLEEAVANKSLFRDWGLAGFILADLADEQSLYLAEAAQSSW